MPENWRLLNTGFRTGAENMAIDEAIMQAVADGAAPPTIRFYGWSPPCLSLGYFQDREKAVDLEACELLGVDCVRRPTGGRAVLHEHEVTYAVIVPEAHPLMPKGVTESYRVLSQGILWGLRDLGCAAELSQGKKERDRSLSAACFDAASWYELVVEGKKLVGSAQMRQNKVILQHGSLLLRFDPAKLVYLLFGEKNFHKLSLIQGLTNTVAALEEVLGREVSFDEVVDALSMGWEETLGITLVAAELTPQERQQSAQLTMEKYSQEAWNAHRNRQAVD